MINMNVVTCVFRLDYQVTGKVGHTLIKKIEVKSKVIIVSSFQLKWLNL